jgi:hypothetical protein
MSDEIIDLSQYARIPRLDTRGGLALVRKFLRSAPAERFPSARKKLVKVRAAALELQAESKLRARTKPSNLRPEDSRFDAAWSALRDRIASCLALSRAEDAETRKKADRILTLYFENGVQFVRLSFEDEWIASQELLERFDEEGNVALIDELAGKPFLPNVQAAHRVLGEALGLDGTPKKEAVGNTRGLADKLGGLSRAIFDYTRTLAGEVDLDDAASVAAFRHAVAGLDDYRARSSGKPSSEPETEADDTATPIPDVPGEPTEPVASDDDPDVGLEPEVKP